MFNADDEGGLYIDIPQVNYTKKDRILVATDDTISNSDEDDENVKLMKSLQTTHESKKDNSFRIFKSGRVVESSTATSDDEKKSGMNSRYDEERIQPNMVEISSSDSSNSSSSSSSEESDGDGPGIDRARQAAELYLQRSSNLQDYIYG